MRLLIITQRVDREDDVLGFFHGWLEKLAEKLALVNVICLCSGQVSLPSNVKVWSLGKDKGKGRFSRLFRFYKHIWRLKKEYDAVFVHMNPIYVFLAAFLWKTWKKRIFLWYNHQTGTWLTKSAIKRVRRVFYTSPFSFAATFQNAKKMPAGVDTDLFSPNQGSIPCKLKNSILYLGRISPIKNLEVLIEAAELLERERIDFILNIVGEPGEGEIKYFKNIKELTKNLEDKGKIKFSGRAPNYKTPDIYNQNELLVNLSPAGLFDKTVLEAMACQTLVLASSPAFQEILPDCLMFQQGDVQDLKDKIINILKMSKGQKEEIAAKLRQWVEKKHGLDILIAKILHQINIIEKV